MYIKFFLLSIIDIGHLNKYMEINDDDNKRGKDQ